MTDPTTPSPAEGDLSIVDLLRLDVALDRAPDHMPPAKVRRLAKRLVGSTREELETDADELFALFGPVDATTRDH